MTDWQRQDVLALYRKGRSLDAVARRLRLPLRHVTQIVRSVPGLLRRPGPMRREIRRAAA